MASSSACPIEMHSASPSVLTGTRSLNTTEQSLLTAPDVSVPLAATARSTSKAPKDVVARCGYPTRAFLVPRTEANQPPLREGGPTIESTSDEEEQRSVSSSGGLVRRRARYTRRYSLKPNDRVLACIANEHGRATWRHGVVCDFDQHPRKSGQIMFAVSYPLLSPRMSDWRVGYFNPSLSEILYDNLLSRWQDEQHKE
ncbi:hypothetical protein PYCCODRAFT_1161828 [Trametes coccinea BRFM310]|uniref:Uncharacterized protein n=1 Tax=Trametes coccinea (strain BRFM310) TaxID=1353009 RepID=A0A1Y2J0B6_TRAC3|nr:hypothetical protein PYCCODRAFT_1161828 [Trametes coccinea BRFM310]